MRYLEINSNFIDNEFNNILSRTLKGIRNTVSNSESRGELDSIMSSFGHKFDTFTNDYFIDHIKVCRKFNHRDHITPQILRVLNLYKKNGVHKMFQTLYPDSFKKNSMPSRRTLDVSRIQKHIIIRDVLSLIHKGQGSGLNIKGLSMSLTSYLNNNGINNISSYFNDEGMSLINSDSISLATYRVLRNKSNTASLISSIIGGDFDNGDDEHMEDMGNQEEVYGGYKLDLNTLNSIVDGSPLSTFDTGQMQVGTSDGELSKLEEHKEKLATKITKSYQTFKVNAIPQPVIYSRAKKSID